MTNLLQEFNKLKLKNDSNSKITEFVENLIKKYEMCRSSNEYKEYLLNCVKEYLMEPLDIDIENDVKCNGKGKCYNIIPGTYIYYKQQSQCNCKLLKCPNFILCKTYIPEYESDCYYGLCYPCSIAYKYTGEGKGILPVYKDMNCISCKKNTQCIEQPHCDHILCLECFGFSYLKPGNGECPICFISIKILDL